MTHPTMCTLAEGLGRASRLGPFLLFLFFSLWVQAEPQLIEHRSIWSLENILTGLAYEPDGSILVLENDGGRLRRLVLNTDRTIQRIETVAQDFFDPIALLRTQSGIYYVAERTSGRIYQISQGVKSLLAEGFSDISSIRFDGDENLYVCELNLGNVWTLDVSTGQKEILLEHLDFPSDILLVSDGLVLSELVGTTGQLGRITKYLFSRFSFGILDRLDWELTDFAIDPIRIIADPNDSDQIFVSVRSFEAGTIFSRFLEGGIYHLNHNRGLIARRFADSLYGPTDMATSADGMFVLEEKAERILFIDWQGQQQTIWDGLGQPSSFAFSPNSNSLFVAENLPDPQIVHVGDSIQDLYGLPLLYRNESIGGIVRLSDGSFLLSLTTAGVILRISASGQETVFSLDIFAPGKLRLGSSGHLFALDLLMNTIYEMDSQTGAIIHEYSGGEYQLSDVTLESNPSGGDRLFASDSNGGSILEYQQSGFVPLYSFSEEMPLALVRIPEQGFLVATDREDDDLHWIGDTGESVLLHQTSPAVVDMQWNAVDGNLYLLSQNGWIRSLTFDFQQSIPTPTVTPTPVITPTPTPTVVTSVQRWDIY